MVNLTFLNDASIIVVNPQRRYPIYSHRVCKVYLAKRPLMLANKKDNAMLINGESGYGKNDKKIINYRGFDSISFFNEELGRDEAWDN